MPSLEGTPYRTYLARVHHQSLPPLNLDDHQALLGLLVREVESGVYHDTAIWHPCYAEVLACAAANMPKIIDLGRRELQPYQPYAARQVLDTIATFFNTYRAEDFRPHAQLFNVGALNNTKKPLQHNHDIGLFLGWVAHFRESLPQTVGWLKSYDTFNAEIRRHQHVGRIRSLRAELLNHRNRLRDKAKLLKRMSLVVTEDMDLSKLRNLLRLGYTFRECREHLRLGTLPARRTWQQTYYAWKDQLQDLPLPAPELAQLKQSLARCNKLAKRGRRIIRVLEEMLQDVTYVQVIIPRLWPSRVFTSLEEKVALVDTLGHHAEVVDELYMRVSTKGYHTSLAQLAALIMESHIVLHQSHRLRAVA